MNIITPSRRGFLGALFCAPAIVSAHNIMPIKATQIWVPAAGALTHWLAPTQLVIHDGARPSMRIGLMDGKHVFSESRDGVFWTPWQTEVPNL